MIRKRSSLQLQLLADQAVVDEVMETPKVPTELLLFNAGLTYTTKGKFLFDALSEAAVITHLSEYMTDGKLPIDYGHAMTAWSTGPDTKAAGWFVPEVREGALWATKIEYTPDALQAINNREWRYYSPTFYTEYEEVAVGEEIALRVIDLCCVALTNTPATIGQKPIIASKIEILSDLKSVEKVEPKMIDEYLKLLGATTQSAGLVALSGIKTELDSVRTQNAALLESLGAKTFVEALGTAASMKAKMDTIEAERETESKEALISQLSKEGKLPPAQHAYWRKGSFAALSDFAKNLVPVITGTESALSAPISAPVKLTAEDLDCAKKMNIPVAAFLAHKEKMIAEGKVVL